MTDLRIWTPAQATPIAEVETLIKIIDRLTKVRSCALSGSGDEDDFSVQDWTLIPGHFSDTLLDFLTRQPLDRLQVRFLKNLPLSALLRILASASIVTFANAVAMGEDIEDSSTISVPEPFHLKSLFVQTRGASILQVLARPQYTTHLAHLRQLETSVDRKEYEHGRSLLCTAADCLECITLNGRSTLSSFYYGHDAIILPLPPFPVLRRF
ncbi:hypothetical protein DFH06DRAFT_609028 [Mycena polygramma]|nr:hypothetical protein DFH06DRAFT_609028 [Mycena polygramma]